MGNYVIKVVLYTYEAKARSFCECYCEPLEGLNVFNFEPLQGVHRTLHPTHEGRPQQGYLGYNQDDHLPDIELLFGYGVIHVT